MLFFLYGCIVSGSYPVYTKRGTIVVQSIKNSKAKFSQSVTLSAEERETLKKLAETNDIYRLRIPVKTGSKDSEDYVTTYTPACAVYESGLSDHLWIQFDQSGEVLGVSIATYPSQCEGIQVDNAYLTTWNTTVDVSSTSQGPTPDTQSYIEKLKREEQERTKGQQGDNRSFFGKYWMYIVPFVLIMMLASSADPNAQGGGGGGR